MSIHGAKALKAARTNLGIGRVATKYGSIRTACAAAYKDPEAHKPHASKKEAARCDELRLLERGGEIVGLINQPAFPLIVNGVKVGKYTADFSYIDARTGASVVEDSKGFSKGEAYRLRKKIVEACHGIKITET